MAAAVPAAEVEKLSAPAPGTVALSESTFRERAQRNRAYLISLRDDALLQNFYGEAVLPVRGDLHGGWEAPSGQLRGHFLGHWMSAMAHLAASENDLEARARLNRVVSELARIQKYNGDGWASSIPEKYFDRLAEGRQVWAPHYTMHKTFMGLVDAWKLTGNREALDVAEGLAGWFHKWSAGFSREKWDDILDVETGGMLEAWADLYGATKKPMYLELMQRYYRGRLFDGLLAGKDVLTNKHANTTIPEAHGAARAYEVTGDPKWRRVAEAYWKSAVTERGFYATGGQTNGEIWSPPFKLASRLGPTTQEHCTVYNMIRLADYLFRWTGDVAYQDYIERNIHNGILAQQNPQTGMPAYFLPLSAGGKKKWGSRTNDFWCCHGSVVQAQTRHDRHVYYTEAPGVVVAHYIPSSISWKQNGTDVRLTQSFARQADDHIVHRERDPDERPNHWAIDLSVTAAAPIAFDLKLRLPWWLAGKATLTIDGVEQPIESKPSSWAVVRRTWKGNERLRLVLPKKLTAVPLPDAPSTVAFMDGPVVLAGLVSEEVPLTGDVREPISILQPDNVREWSRWLSGWRTVGQTRNFRLLPISEIVDEAYTVYFPVAATSK